MAELNLKQIIDRLNAEFTGETRKLVFWYDDKAEFFEDMETCLLYTSVFLTDEEQEINNEIEKENVEMPEVITKIAEMIYEDIFSSKKYQYPRDVYKRQQ